jgi:hypothetical protein
MRSCSAPAQSHPRAHPTAPRADRFSARIRRIQLSRAGSLDHADGMPQSLWRPQPTQLRYLGPRRWFQRHGLF